ncbi:unnamed protein product [Discula destructiva]
MSSIAREGILNEEPVRTTSKGSSHHHRNHNNDRTRSASPADDVKHEEGGPDVRMTDAKPTYKSWKKKYRKMRIRFDELQAQNEELYQLEQKTLQQTKRIAIQNDRALDMLLAVNNRPQMPTDKRYDLSLSIPSDAEDDCILPIDREPPPGPRPTKHLRDLIRDVPHLDFAEAKERAPTETHELLTGIDSPAADASVHQNPPSFLTADDIDNYLWEVDNQIARDPEIYGGHTELLPTLAPIAKEQQSGRVATPLVTAPKGGTAAGASSISTASRDFALRNPTSVYNWLRKHAPKTFLQDHEGGDDKKDKGGDKSHNRKAARGDDDDDDDDKRPAARKGAGGGGRKSSGKEHASIAVARTKAAKADRNSKRATPKDKRKSLDAPMLDAEDEGGFEEPAPSSKGKRKRPADDDTGYRPKGGSSRRPAKKKTKNNSIGGASAAGALTGVAGGDDKVEAEVAVAKKGAGKVLEEVEAAAAGRGEADD